MTTRIEKKIVKYRVDKPQEAVAKPAEALRVVEKKEPNVIWMHEKVERPEMLVGSTY